MSFTQLTALSPIPGVDSSWVGVTEQAGRVWFYQPSTGARQLLLDVSSELPTLNPSYDERGLLGLAFHPQFVDNGRFAIAYTPVVNSTGYLSVSEYTASSASDMLTSSSSSGRRILFISHPRPNHWGGVVWYAPAVSSGGDGYDLYIGTGDGGGQGDPDHHAQNLNSWWGKILRIPSNILATNKTFTDSDTAAPYVYTLGVRNPWGTWMDTSTSAGSAGTIWLCNAGDQTWESVYAITRPACNLGWPYREGTLITNAAALAALPAGAVVEPVFEYSTAQMKTSRNASGAVIVGARFDRASGTSSTGLSLYVGDYTGTIIEVAPGSTMPWSAVGTTILPSGAKLTGMGVDGGGRVYLLTVVNGTGQVMSL